MRQDLKTNYKARGKLGTVAELINRIHRILNGFTGFDGIEIEYSGDETRFFFRRPTGGMNLSKFAFGWGAPTTETVAKNQVWIAPGYIEGRYGYRPVGGQVVSVGGNKQQPTLIIVSGYIDGAWNIEPNAVAESTFTGDTSHSFKRALYRVYLNKGAVVLDQVMAGVGGIVL